MKKLAGIMPIFFLLLFTLPFASCSRSTPVESMTVGIQPFEGALPIFIAQEQGFFTQNAVNLTLKNYDTGTHAIEGLMNNEADAVIATDYTLASQVLKKGSIQAFSSIGKIDVVVMVGRKDLGVTDAFQLAGKRIALIQGTSHDFFLSRFLIMHGVNIKDVILVNIPSLAKMTDALVNGDVDAIISVPPYSIDAQSKLGDKAIVWPAQSSQMIFDLLVGNQEWLSNHPELIKRFLVAVNQSEDYIHQHPQEAKQIAKEKLTLTDEGVAAVWLRNQYGLSLDQSLVAAMEDEARWMIKNNLTTATQVPTFNDFISEAALKAVKPEAVSIIR